ncbi:MAG TPA: gluconate 5-dehydrogenase [Gammaproteobacteria bacterium]|uniref:GMC family oxidoreductase n=1 Tax=OM182 bacterium TaxID=2510334 RepID=A0A520S461_9GAMM|nr:MAG: GMC family oxidoreductase [OM182 bacterium]HAR90180.1 gluconate 5-dehydrogenase [Gammaproteobacteria bacterium]HCI88327.1 gluconate 5-dehydrogenase [Gammaproteobacteria bacterium]|tara:strand:+ start:86 stop:1756 length:1671 start_codon:yes stop_codon:yes gene_type:complete
MAEAVSPSYPTREEVDFVIVGSGAAGGVMTKELSTAGHSVVVLEQGPHLKAEDFHHDEWAIDHNLQHMWGRTQGYPQTFRKSENDVAEERETVCGYAHNVGGSSMHYSGNFWRLRPIDFREASVRGTIAGTNFADWPISYNDLEPYYTKVDWEIGVSGLQGPWDPPRTREYPCPPMPIKGSDVLLERAAKSLGLNPYPAPVAILSQPHNGRPGCIHCGFCNGFGCEVNAKSSSLVTMIPVALASGNCELRTGCTVHRVNTNDEGRVTEVVYWDGDGNEQAQRAKAVVLCANGSETPRLLLMSETSRFADGLANSSGMVGKNLMFNGYTSVAGLFDEPVNAYKSVPATRVVHDFYELDPALGFYGGGGIDGRHPSRGTPLGYALMSGSLFGGASWGKEYKDKLAHDFAHVAAFDGHTTSLPVSSNNISLDPEVQDKFGRPAIRTTYMDHPDDLATMRWFLDKTTELMEAAGASNIVGDYPENGQEGNVHLLGTCRMGNDSDSSVVDASHRAHDVPNLFMCDGSSMVTSGRGQPTMTIMAMAFRAADLINQAAQRNEI